MKAKMNNNNNFGDPVYMVINYIIFVFIIVKLEGSCYF